MRGVGGPLLCISDLLSDVGDENTALPEDPAPPQPSNLPPSHLPNLFQESFNELRGALDGADHSWTALTLKLNFQKVQLCSALETANKLVDSTNSHAASLSEKVQELERIVDRGEPVIAAAKLA